MAETNNLFPPSVYNIDVTYVADKLARYAGEVQMSVSSNLPETSPQQAMSPAGKSGV